MGASHEIELKFLCAPADLAAVLAAAPSGEDETRELVSTYFDTPDQRLQKQGVSLRVRHSKGQRVQTLKRGSGLTREEHEAPVKGDRPDPSLGPLNDLLPNGEALALSASFNVHVTRRQRLVRYRKAEIELALDEGEVRAGGRTAAISEVELELKSGDPTALFDLARELGEAAPLYLSFDGKASRGQALVSGAPLQARRKERVELKGGVTAAGAFQATARNALGQIAANAAVLRADPQPEAVHQLRVAARRLRSVIATFEPLLDEDGAEAVKDELRWLGHACDSARNLHVLLERIDETAGAMKPPPAGIDALKLAVEAARDAANLDVGRTAASARFRKLMIDVTAWIETGAWLSDEEGRDVRDQKATAFAAAALDHRRKKLRKLARDLATTTDEKRHRARIEAKKLRYGAETFASLFPEKATTRFIGRLKELQEELGGAERRGDRRPAAGISGPVTGSRFRRRRAGGPGDGGKAVPRGKGGQGLREARRGSEVLAVSCDPPSRFI
ncbi:CYTH and CHAD domain-containing protein [Phenylobacterium sp. J367]|uniref:CYTH and CHAD domain-containing protein n=1 Tax=Phenylobacterium sp. J367 TaxID=2898435 RepID=UPI002150CABC|nr:CYTH and CHAD domain-containing protein [Phenylobacterium sp. J367]MCR5878179.1 CHAD domain-containing protein [Phenylobacterium sp. J367]